MVGKTEEEADMRFSVVRTATEGEKAGGEGLGSFALGVVPGLRLEKEEAPLSKMEKGA